jgi:CDGSH iron-sulfur domain-containing protein 3
VAGVHWCAGDFLFDGGEAEDLNAERRPACSGGVLTFGIVIGPRPWSFGPSSTMMAKSNNAIGVDPMPSPTVAQKSPFPIPVESGKTYFWCACGKSSKQPFCDGSHKGSEFAPVKWDAVESKTVYFCGCKHSDHAPLCDGSHQKL